jgi:hypothetical protein
MVMLAEHYDFVIGGDPDGDTIDLAILDVGHRGSLDRSELGERRTTGSMLFTPPGQRWHTPSKLHRVSAGCVRRCARS